MRSAEVLPTAVQIAIATIVAHPAQAFGIGGGTASGHHAERFAPAHPVS
jgi:hypothetical protein